MQLNEVLNKTCVIGLSYFDGNNQLLKQNMLAGTVQKVDEENGITIALMGQATEQGEQRFSLPSSLAPWFNAPKGVYRNEKGEALIENPDYLVTWDIYRKQETSQDGNNEWWDWVARTTPPSVS